DAFRASRGRRAGGVAAEALSRALERNRERQRLAEPLARALRRTHARGAGAGRRARGSQRGRPRARSREARYRHREAPRIRAHMVFARGDAGLSVDLVQLPAGAIVKLTGRMKLLLIVAGFALPIVASYVAYFFYKGEATGNYGELLLPPARITSHPFGRMDGSAWTFDDIRGRWALAISDAGACPGA